MSSGLLGSMGSSTDNDKFGCTFGLSSGGVNNVNTTSFKQNDDDSDSDSSDSGKEKPRTALNFKTDNLISFEEVFTHKQQDQSQNVTESYDMQQAFSTSNKNQLTDINDILK
jgi:hypothetical protein